VPPSRLVVAANAARSDSESGSRLLPARPPRLTVLPLRSAELRSAALAAPAALAAFALLLMLPLPPPLLLLPLMMLLPTLCVRRSSTVARDGKSRRSLVSVRHARCHDAGSRMWAAAAAAAAAEEEAEAEEKAVDEAEEAGSADTGCAHEGIVDRVCWLAAAEGNAGDTDESTSIGALDAGADADAYTDADMPRGDTGGSSALDALACDGDGGTLGPDCDDGKAEDEEDEDEAEEGAPNAGSSAVKSARNGESTASVSALQF
jgi:hypothetical protein